MGGPMAEDFAWAAGLKELQEAYLRAPRVDGMDDTGGLSEDVLERYHRDMRRRPYTRNRPWTAEEEAVLVVQHCKHGSSWSVVAKALADRTPNDVKNLWHSTWRSKKPGLRTLLRAYMAALPRHAEGAWTAQEREFALRSAYQTVSVTHGSDRQPTQRQMQQRHDEMMEQLQEQQGSRAAHAEELARRGELSFAAGLPGPVPRLLQQQESPPQQPPPPQPLHLPQQLGPLPPPHLPLGPHVGLLDPPAGAVGGLLGGALAAPPAGLLSLHLPGGRGPGGLQAAAAALLPRVGQALPPLPPPRAERPRDADVRAPVGPGPERRAWSQPGPEESEPHHPSAVAQEASDLESMEAEAIGALRALAQGQRTRDPPQRVKSDPDGWGLPPSAARAGVRRPYTDLQERPEAEMAGGGAKKPRAEGRSGEQGLEVGPVALGGHGPAGTVRGLAAGRLHPGEEVDVEEGQEVVEREHGARGTQPPAARKEKDGGVLQELQRCLQGSGVADVAGALGGAAAGLLEELSLGRVDGGGRGVGGLGAGLGGGVVGELAGRLGLPPDMLLQLVGQRALEECLAASGAGKAAVAGSGAGADQEHDPRAGQRAGDAAPRAAVGRVAAAAPARHSPTSSLEQRGGGGAGAGAGAGAAGLRAHSLAEGARGRGTDPWDLAAGVGGRDGGGNAQSARLRQLEREAVLAAEARAARAARSGGVLEQDPRPLRAGAEELAAHALPAGDGWRGAAAAGGAPAAQQALPPLGGLVGLDVGQLLQALRAADGSLDPGMASWLAGALAEDVRNGLPGGAHERGGGHEGGGQQLNGYANGAYGGAAAGGGGAAAARGGGGHGLDGAGAAAAMDADVKPQHLGGTRDSVPPHAQLLGRGPAEGPARVSKPLQAEAEDGAAGGGAGPVGRANGTGRGAAPGGGATGEAGLRAPGRGSSGDSPRASAPADPQGAPTSTSSEPPGPAPAATLKRNSWPEAPALDQRRLQGLISSLKAAEAAGGDEGARLLLGRVEGREEQQDREQMQRDREQLQRDREQMQRDREQLQRGLMQREQLQREQLQREQMQREQMQREQLQREHMQREELQEREQQWLRKQQQQRGPRDGPPTAHLSGALRQQYQQHYQLREEEEQELQQLQHHPRGGGIRGMAEGGGMPAGAGEGGLYAHAHARGPASGPGSTPASLPAMLQHSQLRRQEMQRQHDELQRHLDAMQDPMERDGDGFAMGAAGAGGAPLPRALGDSPQRELPSPLRTGPRAQYHPPHAQHAGRVVALGQRQHAQHGAPAGGAAAMLADARRHASGSGNGNGLRGLEGVQGGWQPGPHSEVGPELDLHRDSMLSGLVALRAAVLGSNVSGALGK